MYPSSAVPGSFSRPGVRGMSPRPGARVLKMGSSCGDGFLGAADHHAVAAFEAPDAAAGADVHVVNAFVAEHLRAADVVFEIGIAAVDEDVAGFHLLGDGLGCGFCRGAGGNHEPGDARGAELGAEVVERRRRDGAFGGHALDGVGAEIGDDDFVASAHEAARHVGAHSAETDHS